MKCFVFNANTYETHMHQLQPTLKIYVIKTIAWWQRIYLYFIIIAVCTYILQTLH
jgi:hypothetical protein